MAPPTPAALDQQAARLREQAAGLNRRHADREEHHLGDIGTRLDDAQRAATSARSAATAATTQADDMHTRAKELLASAKGHEANAATKATGDAIERDMADDLREHAQLARAGATSLTRRAERAEKVARDELDRAERYDREAGVAERAGDDQRWTLDHMQHAANKLEDKATATEQAATELRTAQRSPEPADRAAAEARAQASLAEADAVTPDFSRIGVDDIVAAGIPLSEVPGAELIDPRTLVDPVNPASRLNDTDLIDPRTPPAIPPDELMDPFADAPPVVPADDTGLLDPLTGTTSGLPATGGDVPEEGWYEPGQGRVLDARVFDRDGDGEPDNFDGAAPADPYAPSDVGDPYAPSDLGDVGDFGDLGSPVSPVEPEPGPSLPDIDVGATTGGYASDSYGDVPADALSGEYGA